MVPIFNQSVKINVCEEASKKEEIFTVCLHYSKQMAISLQLCMPGFLKLLWFERQYACVCV